MPFSQSVMKTYGRIDIAFTHGEGSYLFSEDRKKYLAIGESDRMTLKFIKLK